MWTDTQVDLSTIVKQILAGADRFDAHRAQGVEAVDQCEAVADKAQAPAILSMVGRQRQHVEARERQAFDGARGTDEVVLGLCGAGRRRRSIR